VIPGEIVECKDGTYVIFGAESLCRAFARPESSVGAKLRLFDGPIFVDPSSSGHFRFSEYPSARNISLASVAFRGA
jgi:hypothetical protein